MLEKLRQRSGQTIITILFGMIIVVFIINFGPQANQTMGGGCGGATEATVLEVGDAKVQASSWRYAANGIPIYLGEYVRQMGRGERVSLAMDMLIQRELLAMQAEKLGFVVTSGMVEDKIKAGEWLFLGSRMPKEVYFYPSPFCQPPAKAKDGMPNPKDITDPDSCDFWDGKWIEGNYDYEKSADALENLARQLGLATMDDFVNQQKREWLADMARQMMVGAANVSREELIAEFEHENTTATIEFVKFRVPTYQARTEVDEARVATYLAAHEADVKKKYEAEAASYKDTKPAVRLRQIFIARAETKKGAPAEGAPAEEAEQPPAAPDSNRKKADELHAQLVAGGDFAALARKHSNDEGSAKKGGDLGWRRLDRPGLPDKKLTDALAALKPPAKLTEVVDTDRGYYILQVDDRREGNLTFDQVKQEIATALAKEHFAREAARHDAEAALAEIKAGKALSDLFERAPEAPSGIPADQLEQLRKQLGIPEGVDVEEYLRNQMGGGAETGSIIVHGPAVPAAWQPVAPPAGGAPKPPAAKPVAKPPVAKPVAKPPVAKPVAKPPVAKPPVAKPPAAGADKKPAAIDPLKPKLQKNGPFQRHPSAVPGLGEAPEVVSAIFDELEEGKAADRIFEVGDGFVLLSLVNRTGPEDFDFKTVEVKRRGDAIGKKASEILGGWLRQRCQEVIDDGDLSYDKTLMASTDTEGNEIPAAYKPCQFF